MFLVWGVQNSNLEILHSNANVVRSQLVRKLGSVREMFFPRNYLLLEMWLPWASASLNHRPTTQPFFFLSNMSATFLVTSLRLSTDSISHPLLLGKNMYTSAINYALITLAYSKDRSHPLLLYILP